MALLFTIPKGYSLPDGVKEGKEFTDIATFKYDGKDMMLLAVGQDATPILNKSVKDDESSKPKGAKAAIKEQLGAMQDKRGSESMEDTEAETDQEQD